MKETDGLKLGHEINILDIFISVWKDKKIIIFITFAFAVFSVFYALSIANRYESSALLSISNNEENSMMSSLSSSYGGLASLAGINLPNQNSGNKASLAIELLKSRSFVRHILEVNPDVKKNLMAAVDFNYSKEELIYNEKIFDSKKNMWLIEEPTYLDVYEVYMSKVIGVYMDIETGYLTISVEHYSPLYAKDLLNTIIDELNSLVRKQDLLKSTKSLNYLEDKTRASGLVEVKSAFNKIIESQIKTQMLAEIDDEYLLKRIDPPFTPEKKSYPRRAFLCIVITFGGFLFAIFYSILRSFVFKR